MRKAADRERKLETEEREMPRRDNSRNEDGNGKISTKPKSIIVREMVK